MSAPHAEALLARAVAALEHLELRGALRARLALYRAIGWSLAFTTIEMSERASMHAALGLAGELAYVLEGGVDDDAFFVAHELLVRLDALDAPLVSQLARLSSLTPAVEHVRAAFSAQAFGELVNELEATAIGGAS